MRTEAMHLVAETGVAAHWLYKDKGSSNEPDQNLGNKWLQSLLDIQDDTRDATEFWDHVKVDLFPDAVYVFTPKSKIMAMPRGATIVDFAYAVHSDVGDRTMAAKVNGEQVPLRTELRNGDIVEVITSAVASPNPAWLGFVRTGRARAKIRHHLKTLAHSESQDLGKKLLAQALRAEGIDQMPKQEGVYAPLWDKLLHFTGSKTKAELLTDIGLGKRVASIVAKRLASLLSDTGLKPDALLLSRERFTAHENVSQGSVVVDGSENASVQYAACCRPVPGDGILGYLGRGEGLVVHTDQCSVGLRLKHKDSERFIAVEWAEEPTRAFEVAVVVTVSNGKGVLARVASAITSAEADITHVLMADEVSGQEATDLRFLFTVRDKAHLEAVLANLRRVPSVLQAQRVVPGVGREA
jgi:GTP pyrophosphokinase